MKVDKESRARMSINSWERWFGEDQRVLLSMDGLVYVI